MKNVMDIPKMMKAAKEMQDRLQQELAALRVEGSSGGGMVGVVLDGHKALQSIRIDPEVVAKDEVEMLQDLVVAAFNDAAAKVDESLAQKLGALGGGLKIPGTRLMFEYAQPLHDLIEELRHIPGIGAKTAQRIAFHFLGLPTEDADRLAEAIREAKRKIFYCSRCNNITHVDPCLICADEHRSDESLCIVEEPFNISSIERTGAYNGRYHVLLGALSPLKGRGPDELRLGKLTKRIGEGAFKEIIVATNPTVEGEATALYLLRVLKDFGIRITRLAMGLPVGLDLDFADQVTIKKALEGRTELKE